jgi:hypothetical protein
VVDFVQDYIPQKKVELFPLCRWQQTLNHNLLLPADCRHVIFIINFKGNTGKSWFVHYYCALYDNAQVILPGKKADMLYVWNPLIRVFFVDAIPSI